MHSWKLALAIPLAGAVLVGAAACGDDDNTSSAPTPIATRGTTPAASPSGSAVGGVGAAPSPSASVGTGNVPAGAPEIKQQDLKFVPGTLSVKAGDKVYFKSEDAALHTVDIDGKNLSGTMKKGDVFAWTAATAGTYKVTCDFHPEMKATITVK